MKKKMFRKLREICNELIGKEETNKIITDTIDEVLKEKTNKKSKKKKSDK